MSVPTTLPAVRDRRSQRTLGGLVPVAAVARGGDTAVVPLCVELHGDGAALPLLILSDATGPLVLDPARGVEVCDDTGRDYRVDGEVQHLGLGVLRADVWITPVPAPRVRRLHVTVDGLARTAITRRGDAVARVLNGGPWKTDVELAPERTVVPPPPPPAPGLEPAAMPVLERVPARTVAALRGVVPIGQARLRPAAAVCLWALERYTDRDVLTIGALADAGAPQGPPVGEPDDIEIWDDHGRRYRAAPVSSCVRAHSSDTAIEITPAIPDDVLAIGARVAPPDGGEPMTFGVAMAAPGGR